MKLILLSLILVLCSNFVSAQQVSGKIADAIVEEGIKLYKLESASGFSNQIISGKSRMNEVQGYLSYTEGKKIKSIFWKKEGSAAKILYTCTYADSINLDHLEFSETEREPSGEEAMLISIKTKSNTLILTDTLFKGYNNITFTIVPYNAGGYYKSYILSTTTIAGRIILGNDYLVVFDKNGNIIDKKVLHLNLMPVNVKESQMSEGRVTYFLNALYDLSDYITATSVASLLLGNASSYWQDFVYNSEKYVSVFNLENLSLLIVEKQKYNK